MFYDSNPQKVLRFGDIVRGFLLTHSHSYSPSSASKPDVYQIEVRHPELTVVLTPCCTIAQSCGNMLVISPLRKIKPDSFFNNSYLREDFTRINRVMTIQQAIGPNKWQNISDEEKSLIEEYSKGKTVPFDYSKILTDYIVYYAQETPDNYAIEDKDSKITYKQFNEDISSLSYQLINNEGISKGYVVAIMLPRLYSFPLTFLSIMKAGATFV